jgi:hypothetical protein
MDWNMVGAIGETLGAVGVIATLGYLAAQIGANTRATQASSRHEITRDYRDLVALRLNEATMDAWHDGLRDDQTLSRAQGAAFMNLMSIEALNFQAVWAEHQNGTLDDHTYEAYLSYFASVVITPGGTKWWENSGRPIFVPEMVATVDQRVSQGNIIDLVPTLGYRHDE